MTKELSNWRVSVPIAKVDKAERLAFGFASTAMINGRPVVDHHGDVIDVAELEKAALDYMEKSRVAGEMHERLGVGVCVESVILTTEKRRAMGLPDDGNAAWWVGFRVTDDATWAKVEKGELREFSIGGEAYRDPHPTIAGAYALTGLGVKEVSFVDAGAGVCVPVAITKRDPGMKIKSLIAKISDVEQRKLIEKGLEAAQKKKDELEKGEVLTLADVQTELSPELWAVVLQAIQSNTMVSGDVGAPEPAPAPEGGEAGLELAKAREALEKAKAEVTKALETAELEKKKSEEGTSELRKMAGRLEAVEKERRLEKALGVVRKDFAALPGDENAHAAVLMLLEDIEKLAPQNLPVMVTADVAKHIRKTLEIATESIAQSELLKNHGSGRLPVIVKNPREELEKIAKAFMEKDPKLTEQGAIAKAFRERSDLYEAMKNQPANA